MRSARTLTACVGLVIFASSRAFADDPVTELREMYPGVRVHNTNERLRYFYGAQMTPGTSEAQAAAGFLSSHGAAFARPGTQATEPPQVREVSALPSMDGRFVAYSYQQTINGKEVDGSDIRIKVRRGTLARVDFAAARLAGTPTAGSEFPIMPSEAAILIVQTQSGYENLTIESPPEVVVLLGSNRRPDAWAWRVRTRQGEGPIALRRTFFVDTISPRILHRRDHFSHFDPPTTGDVSAPGMPAAYPWLPYRNISGDLVTHQIPGIRVTGQIGANSAHTFTNADGDFALTFGSTSQSITLTSSFQANGDWYTVIDQGNPLVNPPIPSHYLSDSESTTVGSNVALTLADSTWEEEHRVAQVDTVVTAQRGRSFFIQYVSSTASQLSRRVYIYSNATQDIRFCNALATDSGVSYE